MGGGGRKVIRDGTCEGGREGGEWGRTGEGEVAPSAALPHFDCLVDAAGHHVGGALVEI